MSATVNEHLATTSIRVVIVDDHQLVRDGLRAVLAQEPGIEVVGEAEGVTEAVRRVAFAEPDVVTLDADLPDGSGVEACRPIKTISPRTRILIVTAYADPALFERARSQRRRIRPQAGRRLPAGTEDPSGVPG